MNKNDIKQLIETDDPIVLEIGANNGSDTQQFLDAFDGGKFYVFEPDPRAFSKLDNIKDERLYKHQLAIGNKDGTTEFHQSSGGPPGKQFAGVDWDYSGSMRKPKEHINVHPWCKFNSVIIVNVMKLDTWIEGMGIESIDFLWADTQGCEIDLINGGIETLSDKTKWLYTEYENSEMYTGQINRDQILKLLPMYEMYKDFGGDMLLANTRLI